MPAKRVAKAAPTPTRKTRGRLVQVTVGMPPELIDLLDKAAGQEGRSRTNLIGRWLFERLEQEGFTSKGKAA